MNCRHLLSLACIGLVTVSGLATAEERIDMLVGHFRPLEAETAKFLTPIKRTPLTGKKTDVTAEDRAHLSPEALGAIRGMEVWEKVLEHKKEIQDVQAENRKREEEIERLRKAMLGESEMRPIFEAGKKLAGALSTYGIFRILEDDDMAELLQAAGRQGGDKAAAVFAASRVAAAYRVYVDVGDLRQNTTKGTAGNVKYLDTTYVRDFILKLQSVLDGSMALSKTFKITKTHTITDVGETVYETVHEEMVDDAVKQIAAAIYDHFMATIKFSMKVAPNNPNLEPGMIAVSILNENGEEVATAQDGVEVTLRKGKYTLQCQDSTAYLFIDGKDKKGPVNYTSSRSDMQTFQAAMQDVEFTFKDPDGNFPEVTLTPNGWEGETVNPSAGLNQIRKGSYKMSATLDGYKDIANKTLMISSATKSVPIQMMKNPAADQDAQPAQ